MNSRREPYVSVKAWMIKNRVSQAQIAETLETTENYVNKKLNGTGPDFRLSEVRLLHAKYHVPIQYFFEISVPLTEQHK